MCIWPWENTKWSHWWKKRNLSFWVIWTVTSCQTISKSKHLVHIYNIWSYAGYKGSNQTTAETNTLTYYIVTNKKDNVADSSINYSLWHARLPKTKKDPKIVTVRSTKNWNNDTLIKDLNELPFELIRASADNPLVKLEIFLSWHFE